jgi:hypothetical protein
VLLRIAGTAPGKERRARRPSRKSEKISGT